MQQNIVNCTVSGHESQQIQSLCLNLQCPFRSASCQLCKQEQHKDHDKDLKELNLVEQQIASIEAAQLNMISVLRRMEYEIQTAIKNINHSVQTLIAPIENYRKTVSNHTIEDLGQFFKKIHSFNYPEQVGRLSQILNSLYKLNSFEDQGKSNPVQTVVLPNTTKQNESKQYFDKGLELCTQGQFNEAIKLFDKSLEISSTNIEAIFYKAEALRNTGAFEKSIAEYDRCMKFDSDEKLEYNFGKGEALRALERYEDAILLFDRALKVNINHFNSLFGKADCLRMLGMLEESLKYYNFALKENQKAFTCLKFKAVIMEEIGLDDFLEFYKIAAQIDPNDEYIQTKLSLYSS
ncbi:unnamed protein product (macronuclear) [Paramecium tetraurelia]|uniref:Uncharacterized protein n=1 Tax=Paramecium tetraurelia TaxID=5888 RepID=A0DZ88_PARTE|nr:uncharacterized protein GSPATT00003324001 [Paramecium tetraurelia]CAK88355.1 unnamed protein product [Paramecium tetraurelia]|eukprot:XP_001455752.1 hypothetical protein (macronuclear) [Paramecium tetraurelia strain d4-2]